MNSRRSFIKASAASVASASFLPLGLSRSLIKNDNFSNNKVKLYHRYIAIDNVCAWPNLTVLNDGTIIATIFNNPSHGRSEGDVECWASKDGRFWTKRGTPTNHLPGTNRMNVAAGLAKNGDFIVLASGWELIKDANSGDVALLNVLRPWVSRSQNEVEIEKANTQIQAAYEVFKSPPAWELYDLENDPWEFENLAENPDHKEIIKKMQNALMKWRQETNDPFLDKIKLGKFTREMDSINSLYPEHSYREIENFKWKYPEYLKN